VGDGRRGPALSATACRPRTGTEIVDASFELLRAHYARLVMISALSYVPVMVVQLAVNRSLSSVAVDDPARIVPTLGVLLVSAIAQSLGDGVLTLVTANAYRGHPLDVARATRHTMRRAGGVIAAALRKWISIAFGFAFFFVPGIILFRWYFAIPATVLLENRSSGDAMERSRALAKGEGNKILGTLGLVYVSSVILQLMVSAFFATLLGGRPRGEIAALAFAACLHPLLSVVATLLYYDVRIRREGYDIELLAAELGGAEPDHGVAG